MINAVILDLDGTLVDNNVAHIEAWRRAFARYGYEMTRARLQREIGRVPDELVTSLLGESANLGLVEGIKQAHSRAYLTIARQIHVPLCVGVQRLLRVLRERRIPVAVASSTSRPELLATLQSARLTPEGLADVIVDIDTVAQASAEPDVLAAAVAMLGRAPEACLFVGDSVHDAASARRVGTDFVGLSSSGTERSAFLAAGAARVMADAETLCGELDVLLGEGAGVPLQ